MRDKFGGLDPTTKGGGCLDQVFQKALAWTLPLKSKLHLYHLTSCRLGSLWLPGKFGWSLFDGDRFLPYWVSHPMSWTQKPRDVAVSFLRWPCLPGAIQKDQLFEGLKYAKLVFLCNTQQDQSESAGFWLWKEIRQWWGFWAFVFFSGPRNLD